MLSERALGVVVAVTACVVPSYVALRLVSVIDAVALLMVNDCNTCGAAPYALFPVYGTMRYRLGYDRLSWVLFPLYAESLRRGTRATYTPWPVVDRKSV